MKKKKLYYLWVQGCQMNQADSERVRAVLSASGWQPTEKENLADLIIVVACSVRQPAVNRIFGRVQQWQKRRQSGRLKTILTGCVLPADQKKLEPLFDLIIDIKEIAKLNVILNPSAIAQGKLREGSHVKPRGLPWDPSPRRGGAKDDIIKNDYLCIPPKRQSSFRAYVPIMTGCNNFCAYCVVPYVRGREKSRPAREIINECRQLINDGYKEITLLGQNVNSYMSPPARGGEGAKRQRGWERSIINFPNLLGAIDQIPGDYWLRFLTSHPKDLSPELIKIMATGQHLAPYLHLALQSGDRRILKKMNRHYTPEHFWRLVGQARKAIPNLAISTDVIVGFPGETKKQFMATARLMKQIKFSLAFIGKFSARPGTAAAKLPDNVPLAEKRRREKILTDLLKKTAKAANRRYLNKKVMVLVETFKNGCCFGKTANFKTVRFSGNKKLVGQFIEVKIKKIDSWCLFG